MIRGYTKEQLDFIRKNKDMSRRKLAVAFNNRFGANRTECAIKCVCKKYGWPNEGKMEFVRTDPRFYTREQLDFIRDNCTMPRTDLAAAFNKKFGTSKTGEQMGNIRKQYGWLTGRTGHYEKGNIPFTAGTKGFVKPNGGNFKKGHIPHNHKPVGSEKIDSQHGYIFVKIAEPNIWKQKHRIVWEEVHGNLAPDEVVIFKDGNVKNIVLENLVAVTRLELAWLNRYGFRDVSPELKNTMLLLAKLNVKMFRLKNKRSQNDETKNESHS